MRLDKFLSSQCNISRTDVKRIIKQGAITIDAVTVSDPAVKIDPNTAHVCVNGKEITYKEHVYIMLNKPKGVVSTTDDAKLPTVVDLVPADLKRDGLFPAGRLDADTTGFVLITDDGDFAHRILSPKNHIEKTYIATLEKPLTEDDIKALEAGLVLKSGVEFLPAYVGEVEPCVAEIRICEGKYHQIKRMFAARENKVLELNRIKMGNLCLDEKLRLGDCREITDEELKMISGT